MKLKAGNKLRFYELGCLFCKAAILVREILFENLHISWKSSTWPRILLFDNLLNLRYNYIVRRGKREKKANHLHPLSCNRVLPGNLGRESATRWLQALFLISFSKLYTVSCIHLYLYFPFQYTRNLNKSQDCIQYT